MKEFTIHSYDISGDDITFWDKDQTIGVRCNTADIIDLHPGTTGFKSDRHCDRADDYHIPACDLWRCGSDEGDPREMALKVWEDLPKMWLDEQGNPSDKNVLALQEAGFTVHWVHGNLIEAWMDGIGSTEPDVFAVLPRFLYMENKGRSVKVVFETK